MVKNNIVLELQFESKKSIPKEKFDRDFKFYLEKHGYKINKIEVKSENV